MLTRDQAINAYQRTRAWEQRRHEQLRQSILVRFFGGCGCRMHNCQVSYAWGIDEGSITRDGVTYSHPELVKLAKRYGHEERKLWDTAARLQNAFAKYF
jgi:hypothetical protein